MPGSNQTKNQQNLVAFFFFLSIFFLIFFLFRFFPPQQHAKKTNPGEALTSVLHGLGSNFLIKFSKSNTNNTRVNKEKPGEAAARAPTGTGRSHSLCHPTVLLVGLMVTPRSVFRRA